VNLEIANYSEFLAIHKTIMFAKFVLATEPNEVPSSPYVAYLSNRIFDLIEKYQLKNKTDHDLEQWRSWRNAGINRI
jgi:hypothetical protein